MSLHNVTVALVRSMLEDAYFHKRRLKCECSQCVDDIMAIALNQLPSRYVSTDEGDVYVKAQYFDAQLQSDVLREVAIAVQLVGNKPRHKESV